MVSECTKKDWIDIIGTKQNDVIWSAFHKYESTAYIHAETYNRSSICEKVVNSHRVRDAIVKHGQEADKDGHEVFKEAAAIVDEIAHNFSLRNIRFIAFLLVSTVRRLFGQLLVNKDGIRAFSEIARLSPVVLVPTHNSYFDFILVSFICFAVNLPLPAVVAGQDFLGMAVVNRLLRNSGALFMRRSFASDAFYKTIFTEYVQQVLCLGERPISFFPEGTRSRCGKALQSKVGFLSMLLENYVHGFVQDISFIPISMSFEKITEEQLYMFELLGIPKPKESLIGMLKARTAMTSDYGSVCVHLGKPISLKQYCLNRVDNIEYLNIPRCERHLKLFGRESEEVKVSKHVGETIVYTQQQNMVVFARAVVAALLLKHKQIQLNELAFMVDKLGRLLVQLGAITHGFKDILSDKKLLHKTINYSDLVLKTRDNAVVYDCSTLKSSDSGGALSKVLGPYESAALGYVYLAGQRNRLAFPCLSACLLVNSVHASSSPVHCFDSFQFLCSMYHVEFVWDPKQSCQQIFDRTLEQLKTIGILSTNEQIITTNTSTKTTEVDFLHNLLQPFHDAYFIVMGHFLELSFQVPASVKVTSNLLQIKSVETIKRAACDTYESLSLHTISNIITYLAKSQHLITVRNAKFETLVSGVNKENILQTRRRLRNFVSPCLRTTISKL